MVGGITHFSTEGTLFLVTVLAIFGDNLRVSARCTGTFIDIDPDPRMTQCIASISGADSSLPRARLACQSLGQGLDPQLDVDLMTVGSTDVVRLRNANFTGDYLVGLTNATTKTALRWVNDCTPYDGMPPIDKSVACTGTDCFCFSYDGNTGRFFKRSCSTSRSAPALCTISRPGDFPEIICPANYLHITGRCYRFYNGVDPAVDFDGAEAICRGDGGNLARVDQYGCNFVQIYDRVQDIAPNQDFLIGVRQVGGDLLWRDGTQAVVALHFGSGDCYALRAGDLSGLYRRRPCEDTTMNFICELVVDTGTATDNPTTISYFDELENQLRLTIETTGNLTSEEAVNVADVILEATEDRRFLEGEPERVELVIDSLDVLVNDGDTSVNVTDPVVRIVNNLMNVDGDVIMGGILKGGRVVAALEEQITNFQTNEGNFSRTLENIGVTAVKLDKAMLGSSLAFANVLVDTASPRLDGDLRDNSARLFAAGEDLPINRTTASISVPTTVLGLLEGAGVELTEIPVSFFIYGNAVLFTPSRPTLISDEDGKESDTKTTDVIVSQVISATIEANGISITKLPSGSKNVITTFVTDIILGVNETEEARECVFWNYDDSTGEGFWSEKGCGMLEDESKRTVCSCDRLASFAVLVRVRKGSYESQVALRFITLIGSIISGICLILCIMSFLSLKTYRSKQPTYIHLNLCFSLLGFYIVFLLSSLATRCEVLCRIASAAIHFFCLATVAWMSAEAVNMYYLVVKIGKTKIRYFVHVACLFAYGCSAACAVLVAVLDTTSKFGNANYCFIHPGFALYFGFLIEVAILFVLNFVIFIMLVRKTLCRPLLVTTTRENARRNEIITRVRHGIFFWFAMGLSWVFGFLAAVDGETPIFDYLYCIFIAAQGIMMFLLLCVANPEFREVFFRRTGGDTSQATGSVVVSAKTAFTSKLNSGSQAASQTNIPMVGLDN